jgi:hypothetical protein
MTIEASYRCQRVLTRPQIGIQRPLALAALYCPAELLVRNTFQFLQKNQKITKTASQPAFVGISTPPTLIEFEYTVRNRKRKST